MFYFFGILQNLHGDITIFRVVLTRIGLFFVNRIKMPNGLWNCVGRKRGPFGRMIGTAQFCFVVLDSSLVEIYVQYAMLPTRPIHTKKTPHYQIVNCSAILFDFAPSRKEHPQSKRDQPNRSTRRIQIVQPCNPAHYTEDVNTHTKQRTHINVAMYCKLGIAIRFDISTILFIYLFLKFRNFKSRIVVTGFRLDGMTFVA